LRKEIRALLLSVIIFLLTIVISFILRYFLNLEITLNGFIYLLISTTVIYLVTGTYITELTWGKLKIKFKEIYESEVNVGDFPVERFLIPASVNKAKASISTLIKYLYDQVYKREQKTKPEDKQREAEQHDSKMLRMIYPVKEMEVQ